jgi:hypothetical protein
MEICKHNDLWVEVTGLVCRTCNTRWTWEALHRAAQKLESVESLVIEGHFVETPPVKEKE